MPRPVSDNGRGKFPLINRIVQRKGQPPVGDVLLYIVDALHLEKAGEIGPQPVSQGQVLIGEELLLPAAGYLPASQHHGVQALHRVAPGAVGLGKFCHVLRYGLGVLVRRPAEGGHIAAGLLVQLAALYQLVEIVAVGHVVQIAVLLPLLVAVGGFRVAADLGIQRVFGENQIPVEHGIDHHHDDAHQDHDGKDPVEQALEQVFCHAGSPTSL